MSTERQALTDALNAEYAAVYAYGVIAAHAGPDLRRIVSRHTAAHRARRDATIDALTAAGGTAPPPEPAYTAPLEVTDSDSAARLAIVVETDSTVAWRAVVERAELETTRRTAIDALTECAGQRAAWQTVRGTQPVTVAFPGQP